MKFTCIPKVDFETGFIELESTIQWGEFEPAVTREICKTKDKAVRQALIALGWTPPPDDAGKD